MNSLIMGYGEIGKAVEEVLTISDHVNIYDRNRKNTKVRNSIDVMHVCFPPTETFVKDVKNYITKYEPKHVIVWSSVPIGTCRKIGRKVVHSPVEGIHPYLAKSIQEAYRWIGYNSLDEGEFFTAYFEDMNINVKGVNKTECTEALKLLSTSEYGINIVFAAYKKQVADALGFEYSFAEEWNKDYNSLYKRLGLASKYQKYVLDAPEGPIGGHCIVPNAGLLNEQFPSDLLKMIGEME